MQHKAMKKVEFHRICMYCSKEYGVKWDYPPNGWNGKNRLITHGLCGKCEEAFRKENGLKKRK